MMNQKGITLIELVVVMAIIAIGAALTTPNISGWLPSYRLRNATREVVSIMRVAQIKAVSNNIRYRVTFDTANNKYFLENSQDLGTTWTKEGEDQTLPTGVQFNTTFAGNATIFLSNSTATDGNVTLNNNKGATKTVRLLGLTGRIRIE
jgi:prepilin-type N-terminal cleavage/methylation domain-containing protein